MSTIQNLNLYEKVSLLLEQARKHIVTQVNQTMVETYRMIGKEIVESEQWGNDKANYWSAILNDLSQKLTKHFGRGFSKSNLYLMRQLYIEFPIFQTLSGKFNKLSWSHLIFLLSIKEQDKRNFYMIESQANNRSLRELKRQFDTSLYHRLALSKDKEWVHNLATHWQTITQPQDMLKNPYVLEFLGLEEKASYSESELEQAIINNLQKFLLELWKWFMFVARQHRITIEEDHYYIDLVLYNRFLNCFVLIDLKKWKLTHQDIWQMQMYVNMYDRTVRLPDKENPTIWLLLCEKDDKIVIEYTLPEWNNQIFSSEYQLYIPTKEELESELQKILHCTI